MKKFETPIIEIEKFELLDVIATSAEEPTDPIPTLPDIEDMTPPA